MKKHRFIDLFAGIGGIRLAMESSGFECVFSSEWDRFAARTYQENFQETPFGDIRQLQTQDLPAFDILCGGFPCQPFSIAGVSKKNALGRLHGFLDETQGTLFFEIARIIKATEPQAILLENVKNLVSHNGGKTLQTILNVLEKDLGYHVKWRVLNASAVLPQNRERIFLAGFRSAAAADAFCFPDLTGSPVLETILEKNVEERYFLSDKLWNYLQDYKEKHRKAGHGFGFSLADRNGIARTLSARYFKDGSEILIPEKGKNPRRLTPRECARLMGFPESFRIVVSDTQAYRQFGNSVAVPVVAAVAANLKTALENSMMKRQVSRRTPQSVEKSRFYGPGSHPVRPLGAVWIALS